MPEDNEDDILSPEEMEDFFCATHARDQKGAAAARQDQLDVDLHYDIEAAFREGECVTVQNARHLVMSPMHATLTLQHR